MAIEYNKTNWVNEQTRLNAENMNNIENGIENISKQCNQNENKIETKQDKLVSGTNIKTINGQTILGAGNIEIKPLESGNASSMQYKLYGKRLCVLGDSISTFGTPNQSNAEGKWTYPGNRCRYPQSNLFEDVQYIYRKQLLDNTGMILGINESWAGSLVSNTQTSDSGDKGPNRCISSMTRIGHLGENGTPDIIIVYGGTNDIPAASLGTFNPEQPVVLTNKSTVSNPANLTDTQIRNELDVSTFANAYVAMLVRLQYLYHDALIICMTPNYCKTYYGSNYTTMAKFVATMKEICDYFGVPYIDLRKAGIGLMDMSNSTSSSYLPDGIHPGIKGHKYIFEYLYNFIMSNYYFGTGEIVTPDPEENYELIVSQHQLSFGENESGIINVKLSARPTENITVNIKSENGLLTFNKQSLTFTSSNYNSYQNITVFYSGESLEENTTDQITLTCSGNDYDGFTDTINVEVIKANTEPSVEHKLILSNTTLQLTSGEAQSVSVKLNSEPTSNVTVTITTNGIASVEPSILTFTTANYSVAQNITVNSDSSSSDIDTITLIASGGGFDNVSSQISVNIVASGMTIWYVDNNISDSKYSTAVNLRGGGWHDPNFQNAVNKAINCIKAKINTGTTYLGTKFTFSKSAFQSKEAEQLLEVTVDSDNSILEGNLITVYFDDITIADGEYLSFDTSDFPFLYASGNTSGSNFYSRIPVAKDGSGNSWMTADNSSLGINIGYKK